MNIQQSTPLTFQYLALPNGLGGRGGVQRFFLLSQNIPFHEKLISFADWTDEKQRLVSSGQNPSGTLPIVFATTPEETSYPLVQHIASSRFLAQLHKVAAATLYEDYVQDLVADEYQGFRDEWVRVTFSGTEDDKKKYREEEVGKYLTKIDQLYSKFKTHEVYMSVSKSTGQPLWGDAAMFGLLRDNVLSSSVSVQDLKSRYPCLYLLYTNYETIPAVKEWIDKVSA